MPNSNLTVNIYSQYIVTKSRNFVYTPEFHSDLASNTNLKPAYQIWYESQPDAPEVIPPPITNIYEHLYQIPPEDGEEVALADISERDSIWDEQRYKTELVGDIYGYNSEFERYHERMTNCSSFLQYAFSDEGIKLKKSDFCRVRHCPTCQWRRSMLWKSNMYVAYEEIKAKYPTHRWLFLTLTVKNCEITDLRDTLQHMNKSWCRLIKRIEFTKGVEGWIKTTEITRPKDIRDKDKTNKRICPITGNTHAHPHFHIMLLVKPSYFAKNYIKQDRWGELWGECLRADYVPIVDIRKVKSKNKSDQTPDDAIKSAIMETLKYAVKPADLLGDGSMQSNSWFYELTRQCFKLRFIASGGVLKHALKSDKDITNDDLINTNQDEKDTDTDDRRIVFSYKKSVHKYLYNPNYNA